MYGSFDTLCRSRTTKVTLTERRSWECDGHHRPERARPLEDSRQRYQTLLRPPRTRFVADAETGEIVERSAAEELRGQPRDDIIGRHQTELHPEEAGGLSRTSSSRPSIEVDKSRNSSRRPNRASLPTANRSHRISAAAVSLPDGPVRFGGFRDVSDREERKRELERKSERWTRRTSESPSATPTGRATPWCTSTTSSPPSPGTAATRSWGGTVGSCRASDEGRRRRTAGGGRQRGAVHDELLNYRKDGEQFWNRLAVTPIDDDVGTLATHRHPAGCVRRVDQRATDTSAPGTTRELLEADDTDEAVAKALDTLSEELDFQLAGVYLREGDELVHAGTVGATPDATPNRIERGRRLCGTL